MGEVENERVKKEAVEHVAADRTSSASRARLWASLNRYLSAEAEHERKTAKGEQTTTGRKRRSHRAEE